MGFWDDLTGGTAANAANSAAGDTYAKQKKATAALQEYGNEYAGKFADLSKGYDPYVQGGNSALQRLLSGLGLGGDGADFTAAYRSLPGYQAGLDSGSRAISGNAAARGMLNSGATLKALQRYGGDYEDQRSGNYLQRLMGLTNTGQSATQQQIGTVGTGLQGQLNTRQSAYEGMMRSAPTIGQGQIAGANARAQGTQNLLNTGANLFGKAFGAFGGGGLGGLMGGGSAYPMGQSNAPNYPNPYGGSWYS
jgi:hypothetical protein